MIARSTSAAIAWSHLALRFIRPLIGVLTMIAIICAPLAIVFQNEAFAAVQQHFGEPASAYPASHVAALIVCGAIVLGLVWLFLKTLTAIVRSAERADPITVQNAERLAFMGWIMVAIQLFKYPTAWLGLIVETAFKGPTSTVEVSGTLLGVISVLTLFLLSSIVRSGAAARTYPEGAI